MSVVAASSLRPLVNYLANLYDDNLLEVSWISGIDYQLLHSISSGEDEDIEPQQAQKVVDFILAHKQRAKISTFDSYEATDVRPRFLNPRHAANREQEVKDMRKEKKRLGY